MKNCLYKNPNLNVDKDGKRQQRSRSTEVISKSEQSYTRNSSCDIKNEEFRKRLLKEFNDELVRSDFDFTCVNANKSTTSSITSKRLVISKISMLFIFFRRINLLDFFSLFCC